MSDGVQTSYTELAGVLGSLPLLVREARRARKLSLRAAALQIGCGFNTVMQRGRCSPLAGGQTMNLDELRPILARYRKQVEPAWSPATAHPGYDGKAGDPAGQCGVTSAWAQRRLREDHGIETTYCVGDLIQRIGQPLRDHCWLEMRSGVDRVVIDLTVDQVDACAPFCGTHWDLLLRGVGHYLAHRRHALIPVRDPVWPRLYILTKALS